MARPIKYKGGALAFIAKESASHRMVLDRVDSAVAIPLLAETEELRVGRALDVEHEGEALLLVRPQHDR